MQLENDTTNNQSLYRISSDVTCKFFSSSSDFQGMCFLHATGFLVLCSFIPSLDKISLLL